MENTTEPQPEQKKTWLTQDIVQRISGIGFYGLLLYSLIPAFAGEFAAASYVLLVALFIRYGILEFNIRKH